MNLSGVFFLLGRLLIALGVSLLVPAAVAYADKGIGLPQFLLSAAIAATVGIFLERRFIRGMDLAFGRHEAFVLVASAWAVATVVGMLPYVFLKGPAFLVDGIFESASGFTTTGASILEDVESESAALLLWRALTQWLGGMGIIVLGIAVLPRLAIGGMELLGAEAPGPVKEKLTPRLAQTGKALWGIYTIFTAAEVLILMSIGLGPLDAVAHSFATMATGGFSTRNASIASFDSPAVEMTIVFFMVIAGASFALHFQWIRGRFGVLVRDPEFHLYTGILAGATLLVATFTFWRGVYPSVGTALRHGVFQVTSMMTTTGFATSDFDTWSDFSRGVLFILMFVGGCSGSTGGSVKVVRILIMIKKIAVDLRRMVRPHAVHPLRVGAKAIPEDVISSVTTFILLYLILFLAGGLLLTLFGVDALSAYSASVACLGNVGPGFGTVGPTLNYAHLPAAAKLLLAFMMIVGRLELYTVFILVFLRHRR
jgi:trk system potassium uptake protein TrkH